MSIASVSSLGQGVERSNLAAASIGPLFDTGLPTPAARRSARLVSPDRRVRR